MSQVASNIIVSLNIYRSLDIHCTAIVSNKDRADNCELLTIKLLCCIKRINLKYESTLHVIGLCTDKSLLMEHRELSVTEVFDYHMTKVMLPLQGHHYTETLHNHSSNSRPRGVRGFWYSTDDNGMTIHTNTVLL